MRITKDGVITCHGCNNVSFAIGRGCSKRIVICGSCRLDGKKLKAAREAMVKHLREDHGYDV